MDIILQILDKNLVTTAVSGGHLPAGPKNNEGLSSPNVSGKEPLAWIKRPKLPTGRSWKPLENERTACVTWSWTAFEKREKSCEPEPNLRFLGSKFKMCFFSGEKTLQEKKKNIFATFRKSSTHFWGLRIIPSLKLTAKAPENRPFCPKRKVIFQPSTFREGICHSYQVLVKAVV